MTADTLTQAYQALLDAGELRPDPQQAAAVEALARLEAELSDYPGVPSSATSIKRWRLSNLFNWGDKAPGAPRGLYMWGGVGRGKSMLMDLFYEHAPIASKQRVHFHDFMTNVHDQIATFRKMSANERIKFGAAAGADDPIPPVARRIAQRASLLCFDEMQVQDVATAGILGRLFKELSERGVVVVTTSNRPPAHLYKDGINRTIILPFIALLDETLHVIELNGPTDYRLDRMTGLTSYHVPNGERATAALREVFFRLTDHDVDDAHTVPSDKITIKGRDIFVPKALRGVAVFSFKRLCAQALGAEDYLAIARRYHTLLIVGVPKLGPENRNEAMRFITLIDALYEQKVKLFMAADAPPEALYEQGSGRFEFDRTVSRLMEMQSADYRSLGHATI
ncbi:MAG: cell division protein ZapE [Pseudomonadota bacterium]